MESITGHYALAPNPCTTKPCLPGMAYAVNVNGSDYFLTVGGRWFSQNRSWDGYMAELGDTVIVTGEVSERKDIRQEAFLTIEVSSFRRA